MNEEEVQLWLQAVVGDLADELGEHLPRALDLAGAFQADKDPVVRSIGKDLEAEIENEIRRRARLDRIADQLEAAGAELFGLPRAGLAEKYGYLLDTLDSAITRLEGGGVSDDSSARIAVELDALRAHATEGREASETNPRLRRWLQSFLAFFRLRDFKARR